MARLEASVLSGDTSGTSHSGESSQRASLMARNELPSEVRWRAIESISRAVRPAHRETVIGLDDLHLGYGISDEELESLFAEALEELKQADYQMKRDNILHYG